MTIAVFLEHHEGELQKGSLGVLGKAASVGDVVGVVMGSGVKDLAAQAGKYGAARVFVFDDPRVEAPLPQPRVDAIAALVREHGFDAVLFGASVLAARGVQVANPLLFSPLEPAVLGSVILLGILAGMLPAVLAYRTEVEENLAPLS